MISIVDVEKRISLYEGAQKLFEEVTANFAFYPIILSHLKQKFGEDSYKMFIDNPKIFYKGLKEILGAGALTVIGVMGAFLVESYGINCSTEEFVRLVTKGDKLSKNRLLEILANTICVQSKEKLDQSVGLEHTIKSIESALRKEDALAYVMRRFYGPIMPS